LHLQKCYRNLGYKEGDLPISEGVNRRILSLPIYPEITDEQIKRVVDVLARFIESGP
jgi:dTDP-4-amino-4,6-dideoxygalactose transaminase